MVNPNDPAALPYVITEDDGVLWYVAYKEKSPGIPYITVSAKGVANGLSTEYNDGYDFGPDSYNPNISSGIPVSQTSGIQEAHLYRVSLALQMPNEPYSFIPPVHIASGTYFCNEDIKVYPNNNGILGTTTAMIFEGEGRNSISQIIFQGNANYGFDYSGAPAGINIHLKGLNLRGGNTNLTSLINAQIPAASGGYADFEDIQLASGSGTLANGLMISGISYVYMNQFASEIGTLSTNFINVTGNQAGTIRFHLVGIRGSGPPIKINGNINELYLDLKSPTQINITSSGQIPNFHLVGSGGYSITNAGTISRMYIDQLILPSGTYITNSGTINSLKIAGAVSPQVSSGELVSNTGTIDEYEFTAVILNTNGTYQTNNLGYSSTSGTTAGTVNIQSVAYTLNYKKYILQFSGYENDTTTDQTINFPLAFAASALISGNNTGLTISTTTTGITITAPDSTTTYSGIVIVEGY